jgi:hypothetical protein
MTCCGAQLVVPIGGIIGLGIGWIDGGTMPQIVGGQIGGISNVLLHRGCICPLTHRHTHAADALPSERTASIKPASIIRTSNVISVSPSEYQFSLPTSRTSRNKHTIEKHALWCLLLGDKALPIPNSRLD